MRRIAVVSLVAISIAVSATTDELTKDEQLKERAVREKVLLTQNTLLRLQVQFSQAQSELANAQVDLTATEKAIKDAHHCPDCTIGDDLQLVHPKKPDTKQ